jgi:hypothetical protein
MRTSTIAATATAIVVVIGAVVTAARLHVFLILDGSGGTVLWNAEEADFFIGIRHIGQEVNCLRYPWFLAKSYLGGVEDPDNDRGSLVVIRVTSSAVERHVQKLSYDPPGSGPDMYTPLEGHVYANCPELGGLCRWAGDHFEPATPEERQRLDDIGHLTNKDIDHGENGWSKRSFQVGPGDSDNMFTIEVGNRFRLSASDLGAKNGDRILSIDLLRAGHGPERIWDVDQRYGRVSGSEYQRVFEARD